MAYISPTDLLGIKKQAMFLYSDYNPDHDVFHIAHHDSAVRKEIAIRSGAKSSTLVDVESHDDFLDAMSSGIFQRAEVEDLYQFLLLKSVNSVIRSYITNIRGVPDILCLHLNGDLSSRAQKFPELLVFTREQAVQFIKNVMITLPYLQVFKDLEVVPLSVISNASGINVDYLKGVMDGGKTIEKIIRGAVAINIIDDVVKLYTTTSDQIYNLLNHFARNDRKSSPFDSFYVSTRVFNIFGVEYYAFPHYY